MYLLTSAVRLADVLYLIVELGSLDSAPGGRVGGVEVNNEGLLEGRSLDGLAVLVDEGEVRSSLADSEVQGRGRDAGVGGRREGGGAGDEEGSDSELHYWCVQESWRQLWIIFERYRREPSMKI